MRRILLSLVAFGLLAPLAPCAQAEEQAGSTPAQAFEAARAKLPAPSAEAGFRFEAIVQAQGMQLGTAVFEARLHPQDGGESQWRLTERIALKAPGVDQTEEHVLYVDRYLQPLRGRRIEVKQGKEIASDWTRTAEAFVVRVTPAGGESQTHTVPVQGFVAPSMMVAILFTALHGPATAEYELMTVDVTPDDEEADDQDDTEDDDADEDDDDADDDEDEDGEGEDGESPFEQAQLRLGGKGKWKGVDAALVSGQRDDTSFEWAHDLAGGALIGLRFTKKGGIPIEILPAAQETGAAVDFSAVATSAQLAAAQTLIAFASADAALLTQVLDWPSIHAEQKAQYERDSAGQPDAEPYPDVEEFQAQFLEGMRSRAEAGQTFPREMMENALRGQLEQLTLTRLEGGRVRVTFPPIFRNFSAVVAEREGRWYLVELPPRGE